MNHKAIKWFIESATESKYQDNPLRAQLVTEVGTAMLRNDLPYMQEAVRKFQLDPTPENQQALIGTVYNFVDALTGRLSEASDVEDFSVLSSGSGSPMTVPSSVIDFLLQGYKPR